MASDIGTDEIGLFEAIYSQRAIRYFKPDDVPDDMIHKLIEAGTKAPSGGNRQGWKFLVIRDPGAEGEDRRVLRGRLGARLRRGDF